MLGRRSPTQQSSNLRTTEAQAEGNLGASMTQHTVYLEAKDLEGHTMHIEWGGLSLSQAKQLYKLMESIRNPLHSAQPQAYGWEEMK